MTARTADDPGLAPLRAALLARAREEGDRLRAAAREEAAAALAAAREQADAVVAEGRAQGVRDATARLRLDRARVRRDNRRRVLVAQRTVYDEVLRQARAAVRALVAEDQGQAQLTAGIRRRLGPGAAVQPAPGGGLVGRAVDGSTLDASVEALVQQSLTAVDLEPLWTSS